MNTSVLIVDDDVAVREGLALALETGGRNVITCSDLESAQIVIENERVQSVLCDVRLSGPLSIDGINLIDHIRTHQKLKIVLMSGSEASVIESESMMRGADHFLPKPFTLEQLEGVLSDSPALAEGGSIRHVPALPEILQSSALTTHFQPIVSLRNGAVLAYEGLIRLPNSAPFSNPELLFDYARRKSSVPKLEAACIRRTLTCGAPLVDDGALLFVNVSPLSFHDRTFTATVFDTAARASLPLNRLIVEITEQDSFRAGKLPESIAELAAAGVRFAFDDVGCAYSHLMQIEAIRPKYLKISQYFGGGFETDPTKRKIVANILALARDFDCEVIIEGVENESTLKAARDLGIEYGQGYYFSRPAPASHFLSQARVAA